MIKKCDYGFYKKNIERIEISLKELQHEVLLTDNQILKDKFETVRIWTNAILNNGLKNDYKFLKEKN